MIVQGREMLFEALFSVAEHLDSVRHLLVLKKPQQWWWTQQQKLRHSEVEMLWGWESFCVNVCDNSTTCVSICQSMYVTTHFLNAVGGFVFRLWLALEMCSRTVQTVREQHCGGKHNSLPGLLPCCVWGFLHSSHLQLLFVCSTLHTHQNFQQMSMIPATVWC